MSKASHEDDVAFIQALAELLNRNDLAEISVKREYGEDDSLNVSLSKFGRQPPAAARPLPSCWPRRRHRPESIGVCCTPWPRWNRA